jgi:hypothetical protein
LKADLRAEAQLERGRSRELEAAVRRAEERLDTATAAAATANAVLAQEQVPRTAIERDAEALRQQLGSKR